MRTFVDGELLTAANLNANFTELATTIETVVTTPGEKIVGTVPDTPRIRFIARSSVVTTNSNGAAEVAFGETVNCVYTVVTSSGDVASATHIGTGYSTMTTEHFNIQAFKGTSQVDNKSVRVNWIAVVA
jgi:hypothetical protein